MKAIDFLRKERFVQAIAPPEIILEDFTLAELLRLLEKFSEENKKEDLLKFQKVREYLINRFKEISDKYNRLANTSRDDIRAYWEGKNQECREILDMVRGC